MNDTPRTDDESFFAYHSRYDFCKADLARQLERELNAANQIIRQQQLIDEENLRLQDRIKRLEEAGISAIHEAIYGREDDALEIWRKAKEASQ